MRSRGSLARGSLTDSLTGGRTRKPKLTREQFRAILDSIRKDE